jgi:hypothetical protein
VLRSSGADFSTVIRRGVPTPIGWQVAAFATPERSLADADSHRPLSLIGMPIKDGASTADCVYDAGGPVHLALDIRSLTIIANLLGLALKPVNFAPRARDPAATEIPESQMPLTRALGR